MKTPFPFPPVPYRKNSAWALVEPVKAYPATRCKNAWSSVSPSVILIRNCLKIGQAPAGDTAVMLVK
ncbi:hypothetical protein ACVWYI_004855 [Bradyrhizobium sp. LB13.1]